MNEKFEFLSSTRFWAAVIGIASIYLEAKGWIGEPEKLALASLAAVFISIRTIDRVSEKLGPQPETVILNELPRGLPTPRSRQL